MLMCGVLGSSCKVICSDQTSEQSSGYWWMNKGTDTDVCEDFVNFYNYDSVTEVGALDSFILCISCKNSSHIPRLEIIKQGFPAFKT
jgi:hypothetical protein